GRPFIDSPNCFAITMPNKFGQQIQSVIEPHPARKAPAVKNPDVFVTPGRKHGGVPTAAA
ncbi:MAG: hypothetical protein KDI10_04380, partial [Halioglobus sp.]|nr:hypothetical protein [Halioglobus sp.]